MAGGTKSRFAILVDGREVWRGRDLGKKFGEVLKKNPGKEVGIAWLPGPEIIVV